MRNLLLIILLLGLRMMGQQISPSPVAMNGAGQPWPQLVTICSTNPSGGSCPSSVTTYTSIALSTQCSGTSVALNNSANPTIGSGCSNPGYADNSGNVIVFASAGSYWCQYSG